MEKLLTAVLLAILSIHSVDAIKCHVCGGAENIPKFARNALSKLNITTGSVSLKTHPVCNSSFQIYGDCKKTSGSDMCSNGTFCIKRASKLIEVATTHRHVFRSLPNRLQRSQLEMDQLHEGLCLSPRGQQRSADEHLLRLGTSQQQLRIHCRGFLRSIP